MEALSDIYRCLIHPSTWTSSGHSSREKPWKIPIIIPITCRSLYCTPSGPSEQKITVGSKSRYSGSPPPPLRENPQRRYWILSPYLSRSLALFCLLPPPSSALDPPLLLASLCLRLLGFFFFFSLEFIRPLCLHLRSGANTPRFSFQLRHALNCGVLDAITLVSAGSLLGWSGG